MVDEHESLLARFLDTELMFLTLSSLQVQPTKHHSYVILFF